MKLNVFSPLPPAKTSVANDLWHSLPSLRELAELVLWTSQAEWDDGLERWAQVKDLRHEKDFWNELHRADMTVYHVGNNLEFHGEIWELSRRHPGVIILHDLALQHLFGGILLDLEDDPKRYLKHMSAFYGDEGRRAARRRVRCEATPEDLATRFPLTPLAIEHALGVLVHTRDAFEALSSRGRWPVSLAGLPYAPRDPRSAIRQRDRDRDVSRLIIFGYLGPNRRIESVLKVMAELSERNRFRLDVYGKVWNLPHLLERRDALGLQDLVHFHGFVPEEVLTDALDRADLAINLRYPTMGECSGSQLRIWNHGVPSLVTRIGWYREIPDTAVAFVRQEHEIEDIKHHLKRLSASPREFARIGENGRRYLEEHHSPRDYARRIVSLATAASEFRVTAAATRLASRAAARCRFSNPAATRMASRRSVESILSLLAR